MPKNHQNSCKEQFYSFFAVGKNDNFDTVTDKPCLEIYIKFVCIGVGWGS